MENFEDKKTNDFQKAIAEAIAFFDIFNRPLTAFEIWQYLGVKCELGEIIENLFCFVIPTDSAFREKRESGGIPFIPKEDSLCERKGSLDSVRLGRTSLGMTIQEKNGYYFLADHKEIAEDVTKQYNLANEKLKIALKAARKIFYHNGVEMIAVCNNFNYKKESDIDLFIITSKNRLYLTRALVTAIIHLARLRRHDDKVAGRICLSFYASEENLNLKNIALPGGDPYFYHWLARLEPIWGEKIFEKFWQANSWLQKYLPNACPKKMSNRFSLEIPPFLLFLRNIVKIGFDSFLGDWLEALAKKIQLKKMSKNQPPDGVGVIINDTMLKFHENDRRAEYREQLKARQKNI